LRSFSSRFWWWRLVPARFSEGESAALSGSSDQNMTRPKSVPAVGAARSRSWTSTGRDRHDPSRRSISSAIGTLNIPALTGS
jgi:hypothetical protein